ncbi:hypothetical protein [Fulvivirga sedimenti]|uniref:Outer membrane protein beta-barrel domain-containing protein n=1 Tax=Fulvivirga sedimenti TaxID=2879465 RepID=A0A9X1HUE4_9BACT|nr:hypothetical protein [Fulvivirga sedimenti]MCA6078126.1 hypothetical protein [Fulvivirga sedimenti]
MKVLLILFLMILLVNTSPAQDILVGAGFATGSHSERNLVNNSFTLETSNSRGRKFIIPSISLEANLSPRLKAGMSLGYRRHTISLRGWENSADTCALCPLKKGGGPTIREIRTTANVSVSIKQWHRSTLSLIAGLGFALPLTVDTNDSGLKVPVRNLFTAARSLASPSVLFEAGLVLMMDRFQLRIVHGYTPVYTRTLKLHNQIFPFQMNESLWSFSIMYRVFQRTSD